MTSLNQLEIIISEECNYFTQKFIYEIVLGWN